MRHSVKRTVIAIGQADTTTATLSVQPKCRIDATASFSLARQSTFFLKFWILLSFTHTHLQVFRTSRQVAASAEIRACAHGIIEHCPRPCS